MTISEKSPEIAAEIEAGKFNFADALEDIHTNIEVRLIPRLAELPDATEE